MNNKVISAINEVASANNIKINWDKKDVSFKEYGIDSLQLMNLVFKVEEKLGVQIPDDQLANLSTLSDLANTLNELIKG